MNTRSGGGVAQALGLFLLLVLAFACFFATLKGPEETAPMSIPTPRPTRVPTRIPVSGGGDEEAGEIIQGAMLVLALCALVFVLAAMTKDISVLIVALFVILVVGFFACVAMGFALAG